MIALILLGTLHGFEPCEINPTPRVCRHRSGFVYVAWVSV